MPSRNENAIIATAFVISVAGNIFGVLGGTFYYFGLLDSIGILVICAYAAYWSFDIRQGLSAKLFRTQALGMGFVSFSVVIFTWFFVLSPYVVPSNYAINPNGFNVSATVGITAALLLVFYWVDVSTRAAQRTDPLLRDPLQWRYVRIILWSSMPLLVLWIISNYIPPSALNAVVPLGPIFTIGSVLVLFAIFVSGAVYIPISAFRSKDRTLKTHFKWFALFLACLLAGLVVPSVISFSGTNNWIIEFLANIAILLGSYCVYRSARSLAPLEHRSAVRTLPTSP
jgi:hypothetical protein